MEFGDEVKPLGHQKLLLQRLGEIAFLAKELTEESFGEFGDGVPTINIARCEAGGQELAQVIDHQVRFEAMEPAEGGLATCSRPSNIRC